MSDSDQPLDNGLTAPERNLVSNPPELALNQAPALDRSTLKNLSHNKRAIIERLIARHFSQTT